MNDLPNSIQNLWVGLTQVGVSYGLRILGALAILVLGWILADWARRATGRLVERSKRLDPTLKPLFGSLARYLVLVLMVITVLSQFGVQTASIITVLGGAALTIGLALQGTLQNVAAGVMLLSLRPFRLGDYIDAGGVAGTVVELGVFTTELKTFDGVYLFVPNSRLWNQALMNYSRNPTRRLDVVVGIHYDNDLAGAMQLLRDLLDNDARVLRDPPPEVMVNELADSSVNINLRCWLDAGDYWNVRWDLNREAKLRLEAAGYTIPFPQRDVHLHTAPAEETSSAAESEPARA